jgi:DNA (cytosine-5)-methyltransferase 1
MRILNLYSCLGGNRYKWGDDHQIVSVEIDQELARIYKNRFPKDIVIVGDAHQYLLEHFKKFDFIWSSPPCTSHSRTRHSQKNRDTFIPLYADMRLYQEILFLKSYYHGKYCVENVRPFYEPLIHGNKRGRHIYWTNFPLPIDLGERKHQIMETNDEISKCCEFHEIELSSYKGNQRKDTIARNLVDYAVGKTILDLAMDVKPITKQINIFDEQY